MSRVAVADRREDAIELARVTLAASSAHAFRFSLEGKGVPPELVDAVTELERRYDHHVHNIPGAENPNGLLVKELGLDDYLASRFGIVGTEEECREKIARLRDTGVRNLFSRPMALDRFAFLDRWERVIAPFV
jgi:alkanesulfonate monooxygenase SsuD/methylene tetrahydromethanopterin reductase-like flavin-dependent oxidoreductase (luciferase family)